MRKFLLIVPVLLALLLNTTTPTIAQPTTQDGPNLLRNPGFEGGYFAWSGIPEVQVAHEWTPWWIEDTERDPRWHRPEWKRALKSEFPKRVLGGDSAQQYFTFYASHYAGMYQQVFDVTPGKTYRFSLWVQVWSSLEDNADTSVLPANPHFQIGIDPTGDARPGFANSPSTVVWSGEAPMSNHIDQWGLMTVEAVAQNSTITVYMRSSPEFANKHNDMYMDEASLIEVGAPAPPPPPPPTNTPDQTQPTAPPPPTNTAVPASPTSPPPTNTPPPTSTNTPEPTATNTSEPTNTNTPEPTATETPEPTNTATSPPPTDTPEPDPTATEPAAASEESTAVASADLPTTADQPAQETPSTPENDPPPSFLTGLLFGGLITLALVVIYSFVRRRRGT